MHPRNRILPAAAALVLFAGVAHAWPVFGTSGAVVHVVNAPPSTARVPWKPRAWRPPVVGSWVDGLWVSRDPVDGTLGMPSPEAMSAMAASKAAIAGNRAVQVDRLADGTLIAHLDDRWADFAVARLGADGMPAWSCVSGTQGVDQFMAHPALVIPATVKREER